MCSSWNETRCPQGFVQKNYGNITRIDNIVVSKDLKVVTSEEAILYSCLTDHSTYIVLKIDSLHVRVGQIISSTQGEGILGKVTKIRYLGKISSINLFFFFWWGGALSVGRATINATENKHSHKYIKHIQDILNIKLKKDSLIKY